MYRERDFDFEQPLESNAAARALDLGIAPILAAMSNGDKFLHQIADKVLNRSEEDLETIAHRQAILRDVLANPEAATQLYALVVEAEEGHRRHYWLGRGPSSTLYGGVGLLEFFVGALRRLRRFADERAQLFSSRGLTTLFASLQRELSDEYLDVVQAHLKQLKFKNGVLVSAQLGPGNKGINYVLRRSLKPERGWFERLFMQDPSGYTFQLHPRDEAGARALGALRNRGVNLVANAVAQSADHILSFFKLLRAELAFYIGCLNMHEKLASIAEPMCFPVPVDARERIHAFQELYDVSLALASGGRVVGNDLKLEGNDIVVVTGANRGGKSVFLRSIGLAQLMMQCGMFVGAESFCANVCSGVFTHYKREEDREMKSGKFDEEIARMSEIADRIRPNALMLFNESFAATNDREGSEIARQIVSALLEKHIKVFFVTHLYEFARSLWEQKIGIPTFLRAERQPDGTRTFKLVEARPLETSYGEDLYREIFDGKPASEPAAAQEAGNL